MVSLLAGQERAFATAQRLPPIRSVLVPFSADCHFATNVCNTFTVPSLGLLEAKCHSGAPAKLEPPQILKDTTMTTQKRFAMWRWPLLLHAIATAQRRGNPRIQSNQLTAKPARAPFLNPQSPEDDFAGEAAGLAEDAGLGSAASGSSVFANSWSSARTRSGSTQCLASS